MEHEARVNKSSLHELMKRPLPGLQLASHRLGRVRSFHVTWNMFHACVTRRLTFAVRRSTIASGVGMGSVDLHYYWVRCSPRSFEST